MTPRVFVLAIGLLLCAFTPAALSAVTPSELFVDSARGRDDNPGTKERPLRSIGAAVRGLPDPLEQSVWIELAAGDYGAPANHAPTTGRLNLQHRMRPGVTVTLIGPTAAPDRPAAAPAVFAWESDTALVDVREGDWWLENVQIGTFNPRQRRGVEVVGPGHLTLKNVTFRCRSHSDAGILARRGGEVSLRGRIALNEHLHAQAEEESFCGIQAEDHGIVRFRERESAALDLGNGSLSVRYYGVIRLGCETARITSWSEQSNLLAVNNSGRIDLHTAVTLDAKNRRNTPIGLEHDGHVLGEGARVTIVSDNSMAIALQKASTFACNDVDLRGKYEYCVWASSGSMFVGRFKSDVGRIEATTSATINVEQVDGKVVGPVVAKHAARISLPDRDVLPE